MSYPSPSGWADQLWRSALTLLLVSIAVHFAYRLFSATWQFLLIAVLLLLVIRIAIGAVRGRSQW